MKDCEYQKRDVDYYYQLDDCLKQVTMGEKLQEWAEKYSNKDAVIFNDESVTYKELNIKTDMLVKGFLNLGMKKGDHVVLQLTNSISFVNVLFALEKMGVLPILVLPAHREAELKGIFEKVQPVAYIIPESYLGFSYENLANTMMDKFSSVKNIICDGNIKNAINLETLYIDDDTIAEYPKPTCKDIAHILLSGGTTGTPKLIARTHADYIYDFQQCAERCKLSEDDVFLCVVPASHNFSLGNFGILGIFERGGTVVMCPSPSIDEILPLIEDYEVTAISLVPALVSMMIEALEWEDEYDISSLRFMLVGGSVFEKELASKVTPTLNCKLQQVFGTAEGLSCMTSLDDDDDVIISCQGKPISKYDDVRIVDDEFNDVGQGELGELITRGAYTIHSYYMASDEVNNECFTPSGFYRTGDRAKIDENGNLIVLGRIKEQINRGGEKIMPSEVEANLCKNEDIKEASVVGVPDEVLGNRICAFILSDRDDITLSEVRTFLKSIGVSDYKMPDQLEVIDTFPLTKVGKVDKKALQSMAIKERND